MKAKVSLLILSLFIFVAADNPDSGYKIGSEAINFKLKNIDGNLVSLTDYRNAKGFIIVFTCNHCPYAKLYEDRIIALNNMYAPKGFPVIAINPNNAQMQPEDSFDEMKKRAEEKQYTFPYLVDESQAIAKTYGASRTPYVFVLKKEGTINRVAYIGAIDNNFKSAEEVTTKYVENAVNALLMGKSINENYTKAIGCGIKWKE